MANANWWCADVQHVITRRGHEGHEVELLFSELCENKVCELFYLVYGGPRRIFALLSRSGGLLSETRVGVSWYLSRIWKLLRLEGDECIAGRRHDSCHWFSAPGIGNAPLLTSTYRYCV